MRSGTAHPIPAQIGRFHHRMIPPSMRRAARWSPYQTGRRLLAARAHYRPVQTPVITCHGAVGAGLQPCAIITRARPRPTLRFVKAAELLTTELQRSPVERPSLKAATPVPPNPEHLLGRGTSSPPGLPAPYRAFVQPTQSNASFDLFPSLPVVLDIQRRHQNR